jgi:DNA ligase 1
MMFTAEEIIDYYQKPLICEFKYDGIRAQMHKFGQQIRLFSRKLSDVTNAFPELVNAAAEVRLSSQPLQQALSEIDFILDGEVMAFQNGRPLHFQELQKRLHKKNLTEQTIDMRKKRNSIKYILQRTYHCLNIQTCKFRRRDYCNV